MEMNGANRLVPAMQKSLQVTQHKQIPLIFPDQPITDKQQIVFRRNLGEQNILLRVENWSP